MDLKEKVSTASNDQLVTKLSFFVNVTFLCFHLFYFVFFLVNKMDWLVWIELGSISLYLLLFITIKKRWLILYAYGSIIEIMVHMGIATWFAGYYSGFQLTLMGLCTIVFFVGYFSKKRSSAVHPIPLCLIITVEYIALFFVCKDRNAKYAGHLSDAQTNFLYMMHSMMVFSFVILFLMVLVSYALLLEKKITTESRTDKLTQLPNRIALQEYFDMIKEHGDNYVLAIFDIDNFKKFNDKNGHLCGDAVLRKIACIAKENSDDDFVSRWGGEEFVVISKKEETPAGTYSKIDNIRMSVENTVFTYARKNLRCTITIGCYEYKDGISLDDWIKEADINLYRGKSNGKNQIVI